MHKIVIDSEHLPKFHGRKFGPFKKRSDAVKLLKDKSWSDKSTGEKGLWFVRVDRYNGINAHIGWSPRLEWEELESPEQLPKEFCEKKK